MKLRLDLQFFSGEKTEKATPKKKEESRNKGQVAKSNDVNTALMMLGFFLFLFFYAGTVGEYLMDMMSHVFTEYLLRDITIASVEDIMFEITVESSIVLLPLMAVAVVIGTAAAAMQVGLKYTPEAIKMKLEKIDPLKGFKRIFSARAIVELFKSLFKITLVGAVVFTIIYIHLDDLLMMYQKHPLDGFYLIARLTGLIGVASAILLVILAVPDYIYQRYDHEKQMRMSKHDVKEEHKKMEGDPRIKSKRRQKQMDMAMNRMMQEVPKADVVITNPTHFAVVLKYEDGSMAAPVVTAKGADFVAKKIKELARENHIPMVENKPLARALFSQADIGDEVPEDLFKAVAEVLAYIYRLKHKI